DGTSRQSQGSGKAHTVVRKILVRNFSRGKARQSRMTGFFHTLLQRILGAWAKRMPSGSPDKRLFVDAALWHLEEVVYSRLKEKGFRPGCVIDIGAHQGKWTRSTKDIFDDVPFIMFEARDEARPDLERTASTLSDVSFHIALLGSKESRGE